MDIVKQCETEIVKVKYWNGKSSFLLTPIPIIASKFNSQNRFDTWARSTSGLNSMIAHMSNGREILDPNSILSINRDNLTRDSSSYRV